MDQSLPEDTFTLTMDKDNLLTFLVLVLSQRLAEYLHLIFKDVTGLHALSSIEQSIGVEIYNDGIIKAVLGTNLTYRKPELLEREWYYDVDVSKYTAYFIAAINHDKSVSSIIDPMTKIRTLLDKHGIPMGGEQ